LSNEHPYFIYSSSSSSAANDEIICLSSAGDLSRARYIEQPFSTLDTRVGDVLFCANTKKYCSSRENPELQSAQVGTVFRLSGNGCSSSGWNLSLDV
jgi:hypothetical protein